MRAAEFNRMYVQGLILILSTVIFGWWGFAGAFAACWAYNARRPL